MGPESFLRRQGDSRAAEAVTGAPCAKLRLSEQGQPLQSSTQSCHFFSFLGAYWDGFTEYGQSMEIWQATIREASCLAGGEDGGASGRSLLALTDGPLPFSVVLSSKSLVWKLSVSILPSHPLCQMSLSGFLFNANALSSLFIITLWINGCNTITGFTCYIPNSRLCQRLVAVHSWMHQSSLPYHEPTLFHCAEQE